MSWFKVDDGFHDHPKTEDLPDSAVALWTRAGSWCSRHMTDGHIPERKARRMCDDPDEAIKALLASGLWTLDGDGYLFHDWIEYQPTRVEVEAEREEQASGGRRGNHIRWHVRTGTFKPSCPFCNRVPNQETDRVPDGGTDRLPDRETNQEPDRVPPRGGESGVAIPPSRPVPSRPNPTTSSKTNTSRGHARVRDPQPEVLIDFPEPDQEPDPQPGQDLEPRHTAFDAFWQAYPRHDGASKAKTRTSWDRAVRKTPATAIIAGAVRYRDDPNRDQAYTAMATTWLNQERWDSPALPPRSNGTARGFDATVQAFNDVDAILAAREAQLEPNRREIGS